MAQGYVIAKAQQQINYFIAQTSDIGWNVNSTLTTKIHVQTNSFEQSHTRTDGFDDRIRTIKEKTYLLKNSIL